MNLRKKNLNIDIDLLVRVLELQAESRMEKEQILEPLKKMFDFLFKEEEKYKEHTFTYNVDEHNNISISKTLTSLIGADVLYNCIVAHSDQVCKYNDNKTILRNNDFLYAHDNADRIDIGADDLTGVYVCFQSLIDFDNVKVVIFASEEIGCVGSNEFDLSFFSDCKFIAQLDRKGKSDFISETNGVVVISQEFKSFAFENMQEFGYSFAVGTCTDVGTLVKRGVGISCFNLSCGYYNAHTKNSYQNITELDNAYGLVIKLFNNSNKQYKYTLPVVERKINNQDWDFRKQLYKDVLEKCKKTNATYKQIVEKTVEAIIENELYIDAIVEENEILFYSGRLELEGVDKVHNQYSLFDDIYEKNKNNEVGLSVNPSCESEFGCKKFGSVESYNEHGKLVFYCNNCYKEVKEAI